MGNKSRGPKPWFAGEHFLWGWYPTNWQGWVVLIFYVLLLLGSSWLFLPHQRLEAYDRSQILLWLFLVVLIVASLMIIVWSKGGRPQKQGSEKNDQNPQN